MEKQMKSNNVLLVILMILVLGLGGFIVYDKILKYEETTTTNDNNSSMKNNNHVIYKVKLIETTGQAGKQAIYEYVPSNENNTENELLRNEDSAKTLEIIPNEGAIYFIKRSASSYQKEKTIIYNVDLKSIEIGLKINDLYTNFQSYYMSSGQSCDTECDSYYRLYVTDSEDVYEYDYNFNKIASLSDKIGIKDFKVLGIVDNYAFITDEKNIYAINLIYYSVTKSKGMIPYTLSDNAEPLYIYKNSDYKYYFYTKENGIVESEKYYFDGSKFNF